MAALAVFSRLDLVFFALIMGIWIVLRQSPLRYLLPLDILAIMVSTLAAFLARLGFAVYYEAETAVIAMLAVGFMTKIPAFYFLGLYQPPSSWKPLRLLLRLTAAVLVSSVLMVAILLAGTYLHLLPAISRVVLAYDAGLTFAVMLLIRIVAFLFRSVRETSTARTPPEEFRANWRSWLRDGAIYYGIVGGSLSLYMIWNKLVFGSFSPVSGEIKRWWGTFLVSVYGGPAKTWLSFFGVDPYGEFNAWQPSTNLLRDWSNALLYREGSRFGNPAWQQKFVIVLVATLMASAVSCNVSSW